MEILKYRKRKKLSQKYLADKLGYSQSLVSKWEKNLREPDLDTLQRIADLLDVTINDLIGNKDINKNRIPIEMIEDIIDYEELSPSMFNNGKEYFALKIKGNSMSPKYFDKDIIIVKKQDDCESGQDCVVAVNGDDATFKKVIKKENCIILQPINPEYEQITYTNKEIEELPVRILGVAVEIRRSL